jgi:hypothetical protein
MSITIAERRFLILFFCHNLFHFVGLATYRRYWRTVVVDLLIPQYFLRFG